MRRSSASTAHSTPRRAERAAGVVRRLYDELLEAYGPQGWWPLLSARGRRGFDARGYHPGIHDAPRTPAQRFEVIIGALLAQNTAWRNAEKALRLLLERRLLSRRRLAALSADELAEVIRPSGYFRQKAFKIQAMLAFLDARRAPTRDNLLAVWGVGPETADSILLYAYHRPVFVVDAYTKRLLAHLGVVAPTAGYDDVQAIFHEALPPDPPLYNEYHALIVEHAKRYYSRKPHGAGDAIAARLAPPIRHRRSRRRRAPGDPRTGETTGET